MKPVCVVSCPIDTFSGYGARSRDFVNALIKVKGEEWDIKILPQRWGECPWNYLSQDDPLRKRFVNGIDNNNRPEIWMQITVPNEYQAIGTAFNIGISAGIESTIYPGDWIEGSNRMNLNLLSSQHSKTVLSTTQLEKKDNKTNKLIGIAKNEKPVEVLFEGVDLNNYYKNPVKSDILKDIPEDFCFLYTGHWLPGKFGEDRKNTGVMLKTFLETFNTSSKKKPALIMKTNQVDYSILDREDILKKIKGVMDTVKGNLPNVYLLHGEMTEEELNQVNNDPKVKSFVNFTKGEGFGRPLLEQAITGKPIIASHWSGHVDFLHPDYNVLVGGELKNVDKSAANNMLLKEAQWFNINTDIASRAMKDVVKNYKKYFKQSRKQTQYLKDNFSFDKMCDLLSDYLNQYVGEVSVTPKNVPLQIPSLPKLKPIGEQKPQELPKIKLELPKIK
jgi:glycosyltransferase involved in cell wall biosynthesis